MNRNEIRIDSLTPYVSYDSEDGEVIRTQLAETNDGQWAVRAYTRDSGTEIYRGPFAERHEAESFADALDWQGYGE